MSTSLVSKSRYTSNTVNRKDLPAIREVADDALKFTELSKVVNHEVAQVGAHAIGTMANLVVGANQVQRQLEVSGNGSAIYDDAQDKILQVTGHNIVTLVNAAQQEMLQEAVRTMR